MFRNFIPLLSVACGLLTGCLGDPQQGGQPPQNAPIGDVNSFRKSEKQAAAADDNKPPNIENIGTQEVQAGLPMSLGIVASDPENDEPLTYQFSTSNNSIPAQEFENGVLTADVPQNIQVGMITGQVVVTDAKGKASTKTFLIKVKAMPGDSVWKQSVQSSCTQISDPIMRSACQLGGAVMK